jgi:tRNA(Arg) A34 adenosine deaminase TadA
MLSNRETAFLSMARYFAKKSKAKKKHGAVIVKSGRVVGVGYNKNRNNPLFCSPEHIKPHASRHAEIHAMREAGENVAGAVLYIARVNNLGQDRNSRPCILCEAAIKQANIKKVIYTKDKK